MQLFQRICAALLVFILASCSGGTMPADGTPSSADIETPTPESVPVEIEPVRKGDIAKYIETTANIVAEKDILIYAKSSGIVRSVAATEGQYVKEGQTLIVLEDDELQLKERQAKVTLTQAEDKLSRVKALYENKMTSEENYQAAKYQVETSDVEWRLARLALDNTKIKSSIDGILAECTAISGDLVQSTTPVARIIDPKSHLIYISLPQTDAILVQPGMETEIYRNVSDSNRWKAKIERIGTAVEPKTGTVKITIRPLEGTEGLLTGEFIRIRIFVEQRKDVVLIPRKAVSRQNGTMSIFIMNANGRSEKRQLTIGLEDTMHFEALSGVSEGEMLITVGYQKLADDYPVVTIATEIPDQKSESVETGSDSLTGTESVNQ